MSETCASLEAFSLTDSLELDRSGPDCLVLDVSLKDAGDVPNSLAYITEVVEDYLVHGHKRDSPVLKLYIIGQWRAVFVKEEKNDDKGGDNGTSNDSPLLQREWEAAGQHIVNLLRNMPMLKELTWMSGLPFMACVWDGLSAALSKIVIDLSQPVRLEQDGDTLHKFFITPSEMTKLQEQTVLKELRLFNMQDTYQNIVWTTIYGNTTEGGLRVVELHMATRPDVRAAHWIKAGDVTGLNAPSAEDYGKEYKGHDGKGILRWEFGMGEYLDHVSMRKARIAAKVEGSKPLPVWCLKLDGFVLDFLPLEEELASVEILTCGKNCFDAGLRAPDCPRPPYNRSQAAAAGTHCLVQWPNWIGHFDELQNSSDITGSMGGMHFDTK